MIPITYEGHRRLVLAIFYLRFIELASKIAFLITKYFGHSKLSFHQRKLTMASTTSKRVAVIGAGQSGLAATKACLEERLQPTCYELSKNVGGIWNYEEGELPVGRSCVYQGLIQNSNKVQTAFSDFPCPKDFPAFMPARVAGEYYQLYANAFDLNKYIKLENRVLKVIPKEDNKWVVRVQNLQTGSESEDIFDAVMVCSGATSYPNIPTIPGQDIFKGIQINAQEYQRADAFEKKKVVVIGFGNSGCDIASFCADRAQTVHLSARGRGWLFPRIINGKYPFDAFVASRKNRIWEDYLPESYLADEFEGVANSQTDHYLFGIKPNRRINIEIPIINNALPIKLASGQVKIVGEVTCLYENAVQIKGQKEPIEADVIIYCTGYKIRYPFLEDFFDTEKNLENMYRMVFPVKYPTLGFFALVLGLGPIGNLAELQSRWAAKIFSGALSLPDRKTLEAVTARDFQKKKKQFEKRFQHYKVMVDYIPYMDKIASMIGVKPNFKTMLFTDPRLFWACMSGPLLCSQYRLVGPQKWAGAKENILTYKETLYSGVTNAPTRESPRP